MLELPESMYTSVTGPVTLYTGPDVTEHSQTCLDSILMFYASIDGAQSLQHSVQQSDDDWTTCPPRPRAAKERVHVAGRLDQHDHQYQPVRELSSCFFACVPGSQNVRNQNVLGACRAQPELKPLLRQKQTSMRRN